MLNFRGRPVRGILLTMSLKSQGINQLECVFFSIVYPLFIYITIHCPIKFPSPVSECLMRRKVPLVKFHETKSRIGSLTPQHVISSLKTSPPSHLRPSLHLLCTLSRLYNFQSKAIELLFNASSTCFALFLLRPTVASFSWTV